MCKEISVLLDIPFVTVPTRSGERTLVVDLWLPNNQDPPYPLVVYVHGGGWESGTQYRPPFQPRLFDQGIAVAAITYRFSHESPFPACLHDCKTAIRWLRAHADTFEIDPGKFIAWGISAGGHLVSLLGTTNQKAEWEGNGPYQEQSSQVQAVINWCGPTDLHGLYTHPEPGLGVPTLVTKLLGKPYPENRELAIAASPLTHVSANTAPHLLVFGENDPIVPAWHGEIFHRELQSVDVESTLVVLPETGHDLSHPQAPEAAEFFIHKVLRR